MQAPTYSEPKTSNRLVRRTVAPGVTEQHSRRCRATKTGARCTCTPTYRARVKQAGKPHEETFATLAEAVAWRQSTSAAFRRGETLAQALPVAPTPLDAVAREFLVKATAGEALTSSQRPYARATLDGYEVELRLRVLTHTEPRTGQPLGELPVADVDARAIQSVVNEIARDSRACARRAAAALASVIRYAYEVGLRDELPSRVKLPPPPPARNQVLTKRERRALRAAAFTDDRARRRSLLGPLTALLDDTGLRVSEALGLVWGPEGLDLEAKPHARLRVARSSTKTDAGVRTIVLLDETARVMRRHRLACGRQPNGAYVFSDARGQKLNRSGRVRAGLDRLGEAAGVELSPHVFRHTHATELAASGASPAEAAQVLGHADGGVTFLRTYVHAGETEAAAAARKLSDYRAKAV